jgi:hypothetical protein
MNFQSNEFSVKRPCVQFFFQSATYPRKMDYKSLFETSTDRILFVCSLFICLIVVVRKKNIFFCVWICGFARIDIISDCLFSLKEICHRIKQFYVI